MTSSTILRLLDASMSLTMNNDTTDRNMQTRRFSVLDSRRRSNAIAHASPGLFSCFVLNNAHLSSHARSSCPAVFALTPLIVVVLVLCLGLIF